MKNKKILAGKILKTSQSKVRFTEDALDDIKKAITRSDFRGLIAVKKITVSGKNQQSKAHARKIKVQKRKGRQKGRGSKKGTKHSIISRKQKWMLTIRAQRNFIKELKDKGLISSQNYQVLYTKSKGGFFRNKRHIKLYVTEHHLIEKKNES